MAGLLRIVCIVLLVVACRASKAEVTKDFGNEAFDPNRFDHSTNYMQTRTYHVKKKYRPHFHIASHMGWLNDPAAFIFFNRHYHVFYQFYPYNGAWGHVTWGHAISENLIEWSYYPPAIMPKENYESVGCLSGSAIVHNNYLTIFYTGQHVINNKTIQNQNVAISSDGFIFQKYLYNPIVKEAPRHTEPSEFRNPKVWRLRNTWYMMVGVMSKERKGQLVLYTSPDMFHWRYNGTLLDSYGDMGYMWESPDLFELDGQQILLLSVKGIQSDGYRFKNLYQTGYVLCDFNHLTAQFEETEVSTATFNELDSGHDFYAAHTMLATDGRRLLVAWLGMWESSFHESIDGWASMLTLVRELTLSPDGRINMKPVKETMELRSEILEDAWYSPGEAFQAGSKSFEMIVNSTLGANVASISMEWGGDQYFSIQYSSHLGFVSIDRGGVDGIRRADWSPRNDFVNWRFFVDHSSVEVFCGAGEVVFSSRIYPRKAMQIRIGGDTQLHIVQYKLRRSIDETVRKINF